VIDTRHEIGEQRRNVLFVTLDSLRYDVARAAAATGLTPALSRFLPDGRWEERRTPGTFTLPAHMAFFSGFLPKPAVPSPPTRLWECQPPAGKPLRPTTMVFQAANILDGFTALGYRTVCIGGVSYFSSQTPLGSVLPAMFQQALWQEEFASHNPNSTRYQVETALKTLAELAGDPVFLFLNVSATHVPHHHYVTGQRMDDWGSQMASLAFADAHLGTLLNALPSLGDWLVILCADHGDAFGEDGYTGHGIAHPTVFTVPYAEKLVDQA
jgi:arylsulfatase A-like enzyme